MNKINVIGIGFRPLGRHARDIVFQSDSVLANNRLLDVFKRYDEYGSVKDRVIVHGSVYETLDYIGENYKKKRISLLAAGDPMFFGIGRLVIERFGRDDVEVCPDLSSLQVAFSRIRETSNNALLISLHGGPDPARRRRLEYELSDLPFLIEQNSKIGILTDKENNPKVIASTIQSSIVDRQSSMKIFVCERLGYADERITGGTPEEISLGTYEHPNVVIIIQGKNGEEGAGDGRKDVDIMFGLKETGIEHSKGMITKDEVRAVTLHKLRLLQRGVLWDIGAGSGSVSIEAARICPGMKIIAIEKNSERIKDIYVNRSQFKTQNVEVVRGEAPGVLSELPAPDRVFIGGSGGTVDAVIDTVNERMVSGIVVVNAATIDTLNQAVKSLEKNKFQIEISEVSVSRSKMIGGKRHMNALNPVFVIQGEKR